MANWKAELPETDVKEVRRSQGRQKTAKKIKRNKNQIPYNLIEARKKQDENY